MLKRNGKGERAKEREEERKSRVSSFAWNCRSLSPNMAREREREEKKSKISPVFLYHQHPDQLVSTLSKGREQRRYEQHVISRRTGARLPLLSCLSSSPAWSASKQKEEKKTRNSEPHSFSISPDPSSQSSSRASRNGLSERGDRRDWKGRSRRPGKKAGVVLLRRRKKKNSRGASLARRGEFPVACNMPEWPWENAQRERTLESGSEALWREKSGTVRRLATKLFPLRSQENWLSQLALSLSHPLPGRRDFFPSSPFLRLPSSLK